MKHLKSKPKILSDMSSLVIIDKVINDVIDMYHKLQTPGDEVCKLTATSNIFVLLSSIYITIVKGNYQDLDIRDRIQQSVQHEASHTPFLIPELSKIFDEAASIHKMLFMSDLSQTIYTATAIRDALTRITENGGEYFDVYDNTDMYDDRGTSGNIEVMYTLSDSLTSIFASIMDAKCIQDSHYISDINSPFNTETIDCCRKALISFVSSRLRSLVNRAYTYQLAVHEVDDQDQDLISTSSQHKLSDLQKKYQNFFQGTMDTFDVDSPNELTDNQKVEFFNKIKTDWKKLKNNK